MRNAILGLIQEAIDMGASALKCCELIRLSYRTYLRWHKLNNTNINQDRRRNGLRTYVTPKNKLSQAEYDEVLSCLNCDEFKNLPPSQIVPILLDKHHKFIASESTMHRILRQEKQNTHRRSEKAPVAKPKPKALIATQSNQVWTWDITYLPSSVSG